MNLLRKLKNFLSGLSLSGKTKKKPRRKKKTRATKKETGKKKLRVPRAVKKSKAWPKQKPKRALKKKAVKARAIRVSPAARGGMKRTALQSPPASLKNTAAALNKKVKEPGLLIGVITHYFPKAHAAVIKLEKDLAVGDTMQIAGPASSFRQKVKSLQINSIPIDAGRPGEEVGLLVKENVAAGDKVYKIKTSEPPALR